MKARCIIPALSLQSAFFLLLTLPLAAQQTKLPPHAPVVLTVLHEDGTSLANEVVWKLIPVGLCGGGMMYQSFVCDTRGRFQPDMYLAELRPGQDPNDPQTIELPVLLCPRTNEISYPRDVDISPNKANLITIRLHRLAQITGKVVDVSGVPQKGVTVQLEADPTVRELEILYKQRERINFPVYFAVTAPSGGKTTESTNTVVAREPFVFKWRQEDQKTSEDGAFTFYALPGFHFSVEANDDVGNMADLTARLNPGETRSGFQLKLRSPFQSARTSSAPK